MNLSRISSKNLRLGLPSVLLVALAACLWLSVGASAFATVADQGAGAGVFGPPSNKGKVVKLVIVPGNAKYGATYLGLNKCGNKKQFSLGHFTLNGKYSVFDPPKYPGGWLWVPKQQLNTQFPRPIEVKGCVASGGGISIDKVELTLTYGRDATGSPLNDSAKFRMPFYVSNAEVSFYLAGVHLNTCNYGPTTVTMRAVHLPVPGDPWFVLQANDFTMGPAKDGSWCSWLGYNALINYLTGTPGDSTLRLVGKTVPAIF